MFLIKYEYIKRKIFKDLDDFNLGLECLDLLSEINNERDFNLIQSRMAKEIKIKYSYEIASLNFPISKTLRNYSYYRDNIKNAFGLEFEKEDFFNSNILNSEFIDEFFNSYCNKCEDCFGCYNCENCKLCFNCADCEWCKLCKECYCCFKCNLESNDISEICERCSDCNFCEDCKSCEGCTNYKNYIGGQGMNESSEED